MGIRYSIFAGLVIGTCATASCAASTPSHPPILGGADGGVRDGSSSDAPVGDADLGGPGVVTDGTDGNPMCVATDALSIYWTTEDGRVMRRAKSGGPIQTLATSIGKAQAIAVSDGYVYFHAGYYPNGVLVRVAVGGGTAVTVTKMRPMVDACHSLAVDATSVYFADIGDAPPNDGAIFKIEKTASNGTATPLAANVHSPGNLVLDDTKVYYAEMGTSFDYLDCVVASVPKSGGNVTPLTGPQRRLGELALDATNIYFTVVDFNYVDRGVHSVAKTGGSVVDTYPDSSVWDPIVQDGGFLYFSGLTILRTTKAGGQPITIKKDGVATSIAVDANGVFAIYHTDSQISTLERFAK